MNTRIATKADINLIKNIMESLQCSLYRAMDILKLTTEERKDVEEHFKS